MKKIEKFLLAALFLIGSASPSWARFHGRFYGGFRGRGHGHVSVHLGLGFWHPYFLYEPYYYYPYPSAYVAEPPVYYYSESARPAPRQESSIKDNAHYDIKTVSEEIGKMRSFLNFQVDDGDIDKSERDTELTRLSQIEDLARSQAAANGGYLTGVQVRALQKQLRGGDYASNATTDEITVPDPEADTSENRAEDYTKALADFHARLKGQKNLLKRQLAKGGVTQAQHDKEMKALEQLDQDERKAASAGNGSVTAGQIIGLTNRLNLIQEQIQKDLAE